MEATVVTVAVLERSVIFDYLDDKDINVCGSHVMVGNCNLVADLT